MLYNLHVGDSPIAASHAVAGIIFDLFLKLEVVKAESFALPSQSVWKPDPLGYGQKYGGFICCCS